MDEFDDYNVLGNDEQEPRDFLQEERTQVADENSPSAFGDLRSNENVARRNLDSILNRDYRSYYPLDKEGENKDHPLDWHMRVDCDLNEAAAKRRKLEADEEYLERLTGRINDARTRRLQSQSQQPTAGTEDFDDDFGADVLKQATANKKQHDTFLHRLPPRDIASWLPVSTADCGLRYYLTMGPDLDKQWHLVDKDMQREATSSKAGRLTGRRFMDLLDEAHKICEDMAAANAIAEPSSSSAGALDVMGLDKNNNQENLWVEKYRPKLYTDLLSDDSINRALLTWLKLWDRCVFNRAVVVPPSQPSNEASKQPGSKFQQNQQGTVESMSYDLDQFKRPQQYKVALLCGPPGLGKTTLAHVIARHAGYAVVEMNASDDRTIEAFENRIEGAVQSKRTLDADPRPNCLIVDEVDGAPAPSINYLTSLLRGTLLKRKKKVVLRRPIICICNDLYALALRELRKVALVLTFPTTNPLRLVERIHTIAKRERVDIEKSALDYLCDRSGWLLTVIHVLPLASITRTIKQKWASLPEKVFLCQNYKRKRSLLSEDGNSVAESMSSRLSNVLRSAMSCGEGDLVRWGIFENYLNSKPRDGRIDSVMYGMQWFRFVDSLSLLIGQSQIYTLLRYTSYLPVAFHYLFSSNVRLKLTFPQTHSSTRQRQQKSVETLNAILDGGGSALPDVEEQQQVQLKRPQIRSQNDPSTLSLHTLPFVIIITQPTLRPVSAQLYSAAELEVLRNVVSVMIGFGLHYRQQRSPDGRYEYVIDPPIEDLVIYPFEVPLKRAILSYSSRQLIAREVEQELIRKSECSNKSVVASSSNRQSNSGPSNVNKPKSVAPQSALMGLFTTAANAQLACNQNPGGAEDNGPKLWFKFNEGYTNAVRRTIKMADLFK